MNSITEAGRAHCSRQLEELAKPAGFQVTRRFDLDRLLLYLCWSHALGNGLSVLHQGNAHSMTFRRVATAGAVPTMSGAVPVNTDRIVCHGPSEFQELQRHWHSCPAT